ncbi:uncharacterized protein [Solanum lycopersicum]|uniref:uncharacterized protein n=1 Tax=Solanum lycopersicum TaxID=4081 RepID=UPI0037494207
MASRQSDFTRMNPPTFYGSKIDEEPKQFVDEVSKIILAMGLSIREKAEFVTYQLKDVAQAWVDEARDKRKSRYAKRARSYDGSSSRNRLEIQDKPRFKKRVSSQVPSKFPKASGDRVSNPKFKKVKGTNSPTKNPTCGKCGKKHYGDSLKGVDNCFSCGKSGHKMRDCPNLKSQDKGSGQAQASGSSDGPKKNHFYALLSKGEQETSPDVVTSMLKVFSFVVYALLDPDTTLSFVTPLVAKKFDILPDNFHEPLVMSTQVGE